MSTTQLSSSLAEEQNKVNVNGVGIYYCKNGKGSHVVLLLPSSIGVMDNDYERQLYGLDPEKFTVVVWHPPGLGKSRPPDRTYSDDFLEQDVILAHDLMKILGYSKYSLIGWLNGGSVGIAMAAMFPDNINKLVVSNAKAMILKSDVDSYNRMKNVDRWGPIRLDSLLTVYDIEYLRQIWTGLVDKMIEIYEKKDGDYCQKFLPRVNAPTLVLYGSKEKMVEPVHANYIVDNIKNSRLVIIEEGEHNMHIQNYEKFNDIVSKFLLEA